MGSPHLEETFHFFNLKLILKEKKLHLVYFALGIAQMLMCVCFNYTSGGHILSTVEAPSRAEIGICHPLPWGEVVSGSIVLKVPHWSFDGAVVS